jgi:hypothetical protein
LAKILKTFRLTKKKKEKKGVKPKIETSSAQPNKAHPETDICIDARLATATKTLNVEK